MLTNKYVSSYLPIILANQLEVFYSFMFFSDAIA